MEPLSCRNKLKVLWLFVTLHKIIRNLDFVPVFGRRELYSAFLKLVLNFIKVFLKLIFYISHVLVCPVEVFVDAFLGFRNF